MVEADVDVQSRQGDLLLDLVKGGKHFTCTIDVATGKAKMSIEGLADFAPTAETPISKPGRYHRRASPMSTTKCCSGSTGDVVKFDGSTEFDAGQALRQPRKIHSANQPDRSRRSRSRRHRRRERRQAHCDHGSKFGETSTTSPTVGRTCTSRRQFDHRL